MTTEDADGGAPLMSDEEATALAVRAPSVELLDRPTIQVVTARHPFSFESEVRELAHGPTIADLLRHAGIPAWASVIVEVNGDRVYPEFYHVVRPKPDTHVLIKAVPRGGGGSGQGKNIGYIVGGLVLIIAGLVIGLAEPYGLGWTQGVPLITTGASLLLTGETGLLMPPRPALAVRA